jgi:chemotaxis protein methyltransferase CheR
MVSAPNSSEIERFRSALGERLGLWLDDTKLPDLSALLVRRAAARELPPAQYLALMDDTARGSDERRVLAQELTVTETYFFRQGDQLTALADHFEGHAGPLTILSAGCASGEEPYSIAMTLRERLPQLTASTTIRAADINPAMLERAKAGVYSSWALRDTPEPITQRWFRREGKGSFALDPEIRAAVTFQERNLIERNADLLTPATYHAIFFRNVVMYFTPHAQAEVIERLARALVPGGLLFLGYAETLRGLSTAFHLRHSRDTFFYQRRDGSAASVVPRARGAQAPAAADARDELGLNWFEAIAEASERVRKLTEPRAAAATGRAAVHAADPARAAFNLEPAFDLLRKERFGDALATIHALPQAATLDPDVLLLRCALLVHSGKLEAARATCSALIERDELNAGAHYLLALICEGERDLNGAAEHNRIAAYLDPAFAMPRLHLGLLARRRGDTLAARRELRQAYALLEREETARLLLFAGGFERSALLALCKTELAACGGTL